MATEKQKRNTLQARFIDLLSTAMCESDCEFTAEDFQQMRDGVHDMVNDFGSIDDDEEDEQEAIAYDKQVRGDYYSRVL